MRHETDAGLDAFVRWQVGDVLAVEGDRAGFGLDQPHQRLEERRLADAVTAEQGGDLAGFDLEAEAAEDVAATVGLVEGIDFQHDVLSCSGWLSALLRSTGKIAQK